MTKEEYVVLTEAKRAPKREYFDVAEYPLANGRLIITFTDHTFDRETTRHVETKDVLYNVMSAMPTVMNDIKTRKIDMKRAGSGYASRSRINVVNVTDRDNLVFCTFNVNTVDGEPNSLRVTVRTVYYEDGKFNHERHSKYTPLPVEEVFLGNENGKAWRERNYTYDNYGKNKIGTQFADYKKNSNDPHKKWNKEMMFYTPEQKEEHMERMRDKRRKDLAKQQAEDTVEKENDFRENWNKWNKNKIRNNKRYKEVGNKLTRKQIYNHFYRNGNSIEDITRDYQQGMKHPDGWGRNNVGGYSRNDRRYRKVNEETLREIIRESLMKMFYN